MPNIQVNPNQVQQEGEKRASFRVGFATHVVVYVIVNAILWLLWALGLISTNLLPIIAVITLGWLVALIAHAAIVLTSHSPRQVRQDEVKREVKEQQLHQMK